MADELKERILSTGRVSEEELKTKVKDYMSKGARTELSALKKVYREMATQLVQQDAELEGYFLGKFTTKRYGDKVYLQLPDAATKSIVLLSETPPPSVNFGIGDAVKVNNLSKYENIFTGYVSYETTKSTEVSPIEMSYSLADCCPLLDAITRDGVYAARGRISQVWAVKDYSRRVDGQDIRELPQLPVLGNGGKVNLKLVVSAGQKGMSVSVPDVGRFERLLNSLVLDGDAGHKRMADFMRTLNTDENAFRELRDMLQGVDVVVFGRHQSTFGRGSNARDVKPFMNISQFGWIEKQGAVPKRESSLVSGADEDDEPETDE